MGWDGRMSGWGWAGTGIVLVLLVILLVATIVYLTSDRSRHGGPSSLVEHAEAPSPQRVLADRLARGDIDPAEYRDRMDALATASAIA